MYDYLTKSTFNLAELLIESYVLLFALGINSSHQQSKLPTNETLRRGMSIALNPNEKPAPPVRRTPSMHVNAQQHGHNGYTDLQARMKVPLKRPVDLSNRPMQLQLQPQLVRSSHQDDDFPPPPEFLMSNDIRQPPPPPPSSSHCTLLEEIQRGGFKLRKTMMDRDRSAPRIR